MMLTALRRGCLSLCVLVCSTAALAEPQHAMTLYDEAPKYPSDFTHFDYTNPDAPKGGTLRLAGSMALTALILLFLKAMPAIRLVYFTTPSPTIPPMSLLLNTACSLSVLKKPMTTALSAFI